MMSKPSGILDSYLVLDYQAGNKKALGLLVKRWHSKFCRQAFWYTKNTDVAQDIAQESWRIIINKIGNLKDVDAFRSWALSIVTRKAIDWTRKQKRKKERDRLYARSVERHDSNNNIKEDQLKDVMQMINDLPEQQQIVLRLFYLESSSLDEISKILNISKGTVKSRLFYAREQLKKTLKHRNYEN